MEIKQLKVHLFAPVPIAPLLTLRVGFGLMMLAGTLRFMSRGWVEDHYTRPRFHFSYFGFDWVEPLGTAGMYVVHGLMLLCAMGIILGFFYRISALLFALLFTYCELIDLTYYLNHYYFISIAAFMMAIVPANRAFSLDIRRHPEIETAFTPRWTVLMVQVQVAIVYIYAGLAKINTEWLLEGLPLRIWLPAHTDMPLIGGLFRYETTAYLFSWAGMLYDSTVVFFLLWRPTRTLAYLSVIFFHVITGLLFQIGMFPLIMIVMALMFFPGKWHQRLWERVYRFKGNLLPLAMPDAWRRYFIISALSLHFAFQLLFPWRYLLYKGNLFWNEEGYRFSWRVMLAEKSGEAVFYVKDGAEGREGVVNNREFLNAHQEKQMSFQPDMILQFAHFLADHYRQQGMQDPMVRAEVYVTWNGRRSQLLIDPQVNLAEVREGWQQKTWVTQGPEE
ncbi:MAG: HTTM domain-containing protein [Bacteroidetes bacterium]|nr:MAG: HTTM domain-containing protein [Bacteroidota bacterium]